MCSRNRRRAKDGIEKSGTIQEHRIVLYWIRINWHDPACMTSIRKPITFLAIAQIGALIYSCLVAGLIVKISEDFFGSGALYLFRKAFVMSHYGWLLLVVPLAWFFAAVKYNETQRDFLRGNLWIYLSGVGLFALIVGDCVAYTVGLFR